MSVAISAPALPVPVLPLPDNAADASGKQASFDDALKQAEQSADAPRADETAPASVPPDDKTDEADGKQEAAAPAAQWLEQWAAYAPMQAAATSAQAATADGDVTGTAEQASAGIEPSDLTGAAPGTADGTALPPAASGVRAPRADAADARTSDDTSGIAQAAADTSSRAPQAQAMTATAFADMLERHDPRDAVTGASAPDATPADRGAIGAMEMQPAMSRGAIPSVPGAPVPAHGPALQERMDEALRWMAGNGVQTARIHVVPDALGPITVHVRIEGDMTNVLFTSARPETRHELEASLGSLRDTLAAGGMSLGQASVGAEQQRQAFAQDTQQERRRTNATTGSDAATDPSHRESAAPLPRSGAGLRGNGLVNLYA